jgi:hypothetical protein
VILVTLLAGLHSHLKDLSRFLNIPNINAIVSSSNYNTCKSISSGAARALLARNTKSAAS